MDENAKYINIKAAQFLANGLYEYSSSMLVRECYTDLYDIALKNIQDVDIKEGTLSWKISGMSIMGTPGIGKSYFTLYLFLRLLKSKKFTVHIVHRGQNIVFPPSANAFTITFQHEIEHYVSTHKVVTIFDPSIAGHNENMEPYRGFLVYISSPSASKFKKRFNSTLVHINRYYMSPWTFLELQDAYSTIYKDQIEEEMDVEKLFEYWGDPQR